MKKLALIIFAFCFVNLGTLSAQNVGTLDVEGTGSLSVAPDMVSLSMTVEARNKDYSACVDELNTKIKALKKALQGAKFDPKEIKTSNFSIRKEMRYNNRNGKSEFVGFVASQYLKLDFPLVKKDINRAITALSKQAGEANFNLSFYVSDQEKLMADLIKDAVQNAKKKAEAIADAAGIKLGSIRSITYGQKPIRYNSVAQFDMVAEASPMMSRKGMAAPDINPEDIKNTTTVHITWTYPLD